MRLAALAIVFLTVSGVVVPATSADTLRVTGDRVNVRTGPDLGAPIMLQVHSDQEAVELDRDDPWVRVRLPDRDLEGWIHGSLLAPRAAVEPGQGGPVVVAPPAPLEAADTGPNTDPDAGVMRPAVQAAAVPGDDVALERFRGSVEYINQRATRMAGAKLFSDVQAVAPGKVRVVTTSVWGNMPPGGQKSYLNTLYLRWAAAAGRVAPLRVEVVDERGALLMEKSEP